MQRKRRYEFALGLALTGFGGGLIVLGITQFERVAHLDAAGQAEALKGLMGYLHAAVGKWAILGTFGIAGLLCLFFGCNKLLDGGQDSIVPDIPRSPPDNVLRLVRERIAARGDAAPLAISYVRKLRERASSEARADATL